MGASASKAARILANIAAKIEGRATVTSGVAVLVMLVILTSIASAMPSGDFSPQRAKKWLYSVFFCIFSLHFALFQLFRLFPAPFSVHYRGSVLQKLCKNCPPSRHLRAFGPYPPLTAKSAQRLPFTIPRFRAIGSLLPTLRQPAAECPPYLPRPAQYGQGRPIFVAAFGRKPLNFRIPSKKRASGRIGVTS